MAPGELEDQFCSRVVKGVHKVLLDQISMCLVLLQQWTLNPGSVGRGRTLAPSSDQM